MIWYIWHEWYDWHAKWRTSMKYNLDICMQEKINNMISTDFGSPPLGVQGWAMLSTSGICSPLGCGSKFVLLLGWAGGWAVGRCSLSTGWSSQLGYDYCRSRLSCGSCIWVEDRGFGFCIEWLILEPNQVDPSSPLEMFWTSLFSLSLHAAVSTPFFLKLDYHGFIFMSLPPSQHHESAHISGSIDLFTFLNDLSSMERHTTDVSLLPRPLMFCCSKMTEGFVVFGALRSVEGAWLLVYLILY